MSRERFVFEGGRRMGACMQTGGGGREGGKVWSWSWRREMGEGLCAGREGMREGDRWVGEGRGGHGPGIVLVVRPVCASVRPSVSFHGAVCLPCFSPALASYKTSPASFASLLPFACLRVSESFFHPLSLSLFPFSFLPSFMMASFHLFNSRVGRKVCMLVKSLGKIFSIPSFIRVV